MAKIIKSSFIGGWAVELSIDGQVIERTTFLTEGSANKKIHLYNLRFGYKDDYSIF